MLSFIWVHFSETPKNLSIFNFNYAQNYPIQFFVLILCFSIEVAFKLKYQDKLFSFNATTPTEKYIALWDSLSSSANAEMSTKAIISNWGFFFDAEEYGGEESYVPYFTQFSLEKIGIFLILH